MELADSSELSFMKFSALDDVLARYDIVKREIENLAASHFKLALLNAFSCNGYSEHEVAISWLDVDPFGTFRLYVLRAVNPESPGPPIRRRVGGFGPISRIEIFYSGSLQRFINKLVDFLVESIEQFHRLFTQKYVELHEKRRNVLVRDLHAILLSACGGDKEEAAIIRHCRVSVTVPVSMRFRFHIAGDQLRQFMAIVAHKKHALGIDPVILLSGFLYCEDNDYFFENFRRGATGFLHATFGDIETDSLNRLLLQVERLLSGSATLACIELCEADGYSLQISTKPDIQDIVQNVSTRCAIPLKRKFSDNVSNYQDQSQLIDSEMRARLAIFASKLTSFVQSKTTRLIGEKGIENIVDALLNGIKS